MAVCATILAIYGHTQLPVTGSDFTNAELGKINDLIGLGGNLRYNGEYSQDDADNSNASFRVDSAQLYVAVTPKDTGLTFYIDQQIAPGAAVNREAWIAYQFGGQHYVKAGKMYLPFGLRLEDDSAFVRQATGFNFDSSDNGIELALEYSQSSVNFFIANGTGAVSNNDDKFLFGVRGEKLFNNFRLGSTAVLNDAENGTEQFFNLYAGANWQAFTFLAELDWIFTEQDNADDIEQLVGLFEVNYAWKKGLNLKFTSEFLDANLDIDNNHETRYSLLLEYAPISNLQLRGGLRISDGIPQQPERSSERFFVQSHLYF